jgi:hypothetical protein
MGSESCEAWRTVLDDLIKRATLAHAICDASGQYPGNEGRCREQNLGAAIQLVSYHEYPK